MRRVLWWLAVAVVAAALFSNLVALPIISGISFWLAILATLILAMLSYPR